MFTTTFKTVIAAAIAFPVITATPALAGKVENAVYKAVVDQKQTKKVKAYGHHFNIKPVKVTRNGTGYIVEGRLSHHLSYRKDDQYRYTVKVNYRGDIIEMEEKINRGGLTSVLAKIPIGEILKKKSETAKDAPVDSKTINSAIKKAGRWIGRKYDGKWEVAARKVVVVIGAQVAKSRGYTN